MIVLLDTGPTQRETAADELGAGGLVSVPHRQGRYRHRHRKARSLPAPGGFILADGPSTTSAWGTFDPPTLEEITSHFWRKR